MAKKKDLVIVESPAKARTISGLLGKDFLVKASVGHVRDLVKGGKNGIGISLDTFEPVYKVISNKRDIVKELTEDARNAKTVFLASDPDREGEAIAWHIVHAAKIDESKIKRVIFHEITAKAVNEAFDHPENLNYDLVNAQQARRVLDRIVGFQLSPFLWKKVKTGLSAGRVQSVALRFIAEREQEIEVFIPKEYWVLSVNLVKSTDANNVSQSILFQLQGINDKKGKFLITNQKQAEDCKVDLSNVDQVFNVVNITNKIRKVNPPPPFITSTLQQEGWRRFRIPASQVMRIAQNLYEGIDLGKSNPVGLITYMRTDSTNVSSAVLGQVKKRIQADFGNEYALKTPRMYSKKIKMAQEAHEAIRPTDFNLSPSSLKAHLSLEQYRIYSMIWNRMLASQMTEASFKDTVIEVESIGSKSGDLYRFVANHSDLIFDGFRVIQDSTNNKTNNNQEKKIFDKFNNNEQLIVSSSENSFKLDQEFTEPPSRYTEGSIIKALESKGIGRPSTYAAIIDTLLNQREYIEREKGGLKVTKLGSVVNKMLTEHCPKYVEVDFTAKVEENLDDIARGNLPWIDFVSDFYKPFKKNLDEALEKAERIPSSYFHETTGISCKECESPVVIKSGRNGRFLACSGFPNCRNILGSLSLRIKVAVEQSRPDCLKNCLGDSHCINCTHLQCPKCNSDLIERQSKKSKIYYSCFDYKNCDYFVNRTLCLDVPCKECGSLVIEMGRKQIKCEKCQWIGEKES